MPALRFAFRSPKDAREVLTILQLVISKQWTGFKTGQFCIHKGYTLDPPSAHAAVSIGLTSGLNPPANSQPSGEEGVGHSDGHVVAAPPRRAHEQPAAAVSLPAVCSFRGCQSSVA